MREMLISIVLRTYNESKHLDELLKSVHSQDIPGANVETVVIDSGSTDSTLEIAEKYNCRILHITPEEFTFGRSLNIGCNAANGEYLVFISGHCIPVGSRWLRNLVAPLADGLASYAYGKQIGNQDSKFSECQLFKKYYPDESRVPQKGFFCNNANAALLKKAWESNRFDEELSGLEDMELSRRLQHNGMSIAYVADAPVYHIHEESWKNIRNRYEREAYALRHIMPEVHIGFLDFVRYFTSAVYFDVKEAVRAKCFNREFYGIVMFRLMQFWGSYKGNHEHRKLSKKMKERYFYPK